MRYTVYRRSPYRWEAQYAATEPLEMIAPCLTTNDLQAAKFAALLWAKWFGDTAFVWDTTTRKRVGEYGMNSPLGGAVANAPAIMPRAR
jgi:hypothetical protein